MIHRHTRERIGVGEGAGSQIGEDGDLLESINYCTDLYLGSDSRETPSPSPNAEHSREPQWREWRGVFFLIRGVVPRTEGTR